MDRFPDVSIVLRDLDYFEEFDKIIFKFNNDFKSLINNKEYLVKYADLMEMYKLSESDFFSIDIADYLVYDEDGKIRVGDSMFRYPTYMYDIIYDLICKALIYTIKNTLNEYVTLDKKSVLEYAELRSYFKYAYCEKMRTYLPQMEGKPKVIEDEDKNLIPIYDLNKEEFRQRNLHGAVLMACLNSEGLKYKKYVKTEKPENVEENLESETEPQVDTL